MWSTRSGDATKAERIAVESEQEAAHDELDTKRLAVIDQLGCEVFGLH